MRNNHYHNRVIGPDFNIGELVITLSRDEVMKRLGIDQGFTGSVGVVCRVIDKELICGKWMISVEDISGKMEYLSAGWLDQYIFEAYLPKIREDKLSKILSK